MEEGVERLDFMGIAEVNYFPWILKLSVIHPIFIYNSLPPSFPVRANIQLIFNS